MRRITSGPLWWLAGGAAAAGVWLGGSAFWLAARDPVDFAAQRRESLQGLGDEQARAQTSLVETRQRCAKLAADLAVAQERARDAARAIQALRADDRWWRTLWEKLFGDAEAASSKEERLARLEAMRTVALAREPELRAALTRATWERDGAEIALARAERNLAVVERDTKSRHYLALAWTKSRWYVVGGLAAWVLLFLWRRANSEAKNPGS